MRAEQFIVAVFAVLAGFGYHLSCWRALQSPVIVGHGMDGAQTFVIGFRDAVITVDHRLHVSVESMSWSEVPGLREASGLLCWAATLTATNLVLSATSVGILLAVACGFTRLLRNHPVRWILDTVLAVLLSFAAVTHLLITAAQRRIEHRLPEFLVAHLGPNTVDVGSPTVCCGCYIRHPTVAAIAFGLISAFLLYRSSSAPDAAQEITWKEVDFSEMGSDDEAADFIVAVTIEVAEVECEHQPKSVEDIPSS